jgi:hypothetical protein
LCHYSIDPMAPISVGARLVLARMARKEVRASAQKGGRYALDCFRCSTGAVAGRDSEFIHIGRVYPYLVATGPDYARLQSCVGTQKCGLNHHRLQARRRQPRK